VRDVCTVRLVYKAGVTYDMITPKLHSGVNLARGGVVLAGLKPMCLPYIKFMRNITYI